MRIKSAVPHYSLHPFPCWLQESRSPVLPPLHELTEHPRQKLGCFFTPPSALESHLQPSMPSCSVQMKANGMHRVDWRGRERGREGEKAVGCTIASHTTFEYRIAPNGKVRRLGQYISVYRLFFYVVERAICSNLCLTFFCSTVKQE